eukprot:scaffold9181_cov132-Skeletonema_dohrnii-CCMP3373.AAC.1
MGRSTLWGFGTDFTSQKWLSLDPCGILCVSLSISIHLFALFALGFTMISHYLLSQILYALLYVPFSALALASLFMATTTDPGAVPMGARPIPANLASESDSIVTERDTVRGGLRRRRGIRRCRKCNDNYKPPRAHHDSVTGRCVVKMDHFGIMNHKFFILFILYTFLTAIVSLALILIKFIRCGISVQPSNNVSQDNVNKTLQYVVDSYYEDHQQQQQYDNMFLNSEEQTKPGCDAMMNSDSMIIFTLLVIVTILFFFFTCCMLIEQGEAVDTNMSKIARMKTRAGLSNADEYRPVATEFNEVFGGEHPTLSWHWFLPLPVRFPEWARDNVLGYEYNSTFPPVPYQEPSDDTDTESAASRGSSVSLGRLSVTSDRDLGDVESDIENVYVGGGVTLDQDSSSVKKRSTAASIT